VAAWAGLAVLGDGALAAVPGGRRVGLSTEFLATLLVVSMAALGIAVVIGLRRRRGARRVE